MSDFEIPGIKPSTERHLHKDQTLFHLGDPVTHIYFIRQGKIRMVRHQTDGTPVTFHLATSPQLFAEASLFSERYHCDAVAEEDCLFAVYSKPELLAAFARQPETALAFMAHLARQIQALRSRIELINTKSAPTRVLSYIQSALSPGEHQLTIAQPWKSIAAEIGLTHEALYRALAKLQKSGNIDRDGRTVRLLRNPGITPSGQPQALRS